MTCASPRLEDGMVQSGVSTALVVGGGIGGLTAAIALGRKGIAVELIERDPEWSVYGVGIIQQSNVVRAMDDLGLLDAYVSAGRGFDELEIYLPNGVRIAKVPTPPLVPGRPANMGIARPALQKVLADSARASGTEVRLGLTIERMEDDGEGVTVDFSDRSRRRYDIVVAADGIYSDMRERLWPGAASPEFVGQGVWRYNFPRPADMVSLNVYNGPTGVGLVPMSDTQMYLYATTPEAENPHYPRNSLARAMREKLRGVPAPQIRSLAAQIIEDAKVVYRPLETLFLGGDWHRGRVVLLGDAVHSTTPHLGQGAGMAIEDAIVLADELERHQAPEAAFRAYRNRRYERCRYICEASRAICDGQLGKAAPVDNHAATSAMFKVVSQPL